MSVRRATVVPPESSLARVLAASRNVSAPRNNREPDLLITTGTFEAMGADGGTMTMAFTQALDVTYQDDSVYNTTKFATPFDHGHEVMRSLPNVVPRQYVAMLPDSPEFDLEEGVLYYRQQTKVTGEDQRAIGAGIGLFWSLNYPPPLLVEPYLRSQTLRDVLRNLVSRVYASAMVRAPVPTNPNATVEARVLTNRNVSFAGEPEIWKQPPDPPEPDFDFLGQIRLPLH